jgi:segregation and condensation protein B
MNITAEKLQHILEAAIMVAGRPLTIANMQKLFDEGEEPESHEIKSALTAIQEKYKDNGIELKEVASGYQFQAKTESSHWLSRLWEERAPRYSRAFLETLALIAYRQPVTRAEIEEIRGVSASSHIVKTLQDREWVRILGYKDVPGKPALYGTTKAFLDYFNLKSLDELPTLAELKDLASQEAKLQGELDLENAKLAPNSDESTEHAAEITINNNPTADTEIINETSESPENEVVLSIHDITSDSAATSENDLESVTESTLTE